MVNFNILYKKMDNQSISHTLVYSYYSYNSIFTNLLVNYMEEITKLNVKDMNFNSTIFVIDELLHNYSL